MTTAQSNTNGGKKTIQITQIRLFIYSLFALTFIDGTFCGWRMRDGGGRTMVMNGVDGGDVDDIDATRP